MKILNRWTLSIIFENDKETISFTKDILQIGCKRFLIEEWKNFNDETISNMESNALTFWNKWKQFIFTAIELSFGDNNE